MKPHLLSVLAFVLLAPNADAQSLKLPTTIFASAAAADWTSTYVTNTRMGLYEDNPLINGLQNRPALMVAVGAGIDAASVLAWNRVIGRKHPKLAAAGLYVAAGVRVFLAARNVARGLRNEVRLP